MRVLVVLAAFRASLTLADGAAITWSQAVGKCTLSDGGKTSFIVKPQYGDVATCEAECGYYCDAWRFATRDQVCVHHWNGAGPIAGGDGDPEEGTCHIKAYPEVNYEGTYTSATGCCETADGTCVDSKGSDIALNTSLDECKAWCNREFYCSGFAHMGFNNLCTIFIAHADENKAVQALRGSPPPMTCYLRDSTEETAACSDFDNDKKGCKKAEGLDCAYDKSTKKCTETVLEGCALEGEDTCADVLGCKWKNGKCKGTPNTATGCARFRKNKAKCKEAGCTYLKPDCVDAVDCSAGNGAKNTCKSLSGCKWNKTEGECRAK